MLPHRSRRVASRAIKAQRTVRRSSYAVGSEPHFTSVNVQCGGGGNTTIHIHNPPTTSPLPVLLYIAPTTDLRDLTFPFIPSSFLGNSHTTVLIRPLFSPATPFPQPLHVLSYAYAEIVKHHVSKSDFKPPPPISVYGKGLGGTLATALALTECRPLNGGKSFVDAVMSRDSIYDYSPLANEYLTRFAKKKQEKEPFDRNAYLSPDSDLAYASPPSNDFVSGPATSSTAEDIAASNIKSREQLIKSLPHLFSKPEVAFDPFISPLLFFRGLSHETPTSWTWSGPPGKKSDVNLEALERSRSYVKFPPAESGLSIPWARLCVTGAADSQPKMTPKRIGRPAKGSPTRMAETALHGENIGAAMGGEWALQALYEEQANLLASGMRRAIAKGHEDPRLLYHVRDVDATERVQVVHLPASRADEQERDDMDGLAMHEWISEI